MPDDATKELLERDAEGEDRSAGVADYFEVLALGKAKAAREEGDDTAADHEDAEAERHRTDAVRLRDWAALNRVIASLDRNVEEPE